ncbi:MAG: hypothetical protein KIT09_23650 [Bryobacteraceae bacterium]|nr:hypothetical protein [Bryobacteraceae bacterium]
MNDALKGFLTVVVAIGLSIAWAYVGNELADQPLEPGGAIAIGLAFGLLYGLQAGILSSYDLGAGTGWLKLLVDFTWSFPNTVWGFVIGNLIFWFFGYPSRALSKGVGWIAFKPYGSSGFGHNVLQTHGTVNLGGAGQHELLHVLQARVFGPLFLPIYAVNYVINFVIQLIWTITLGWILAAAKVRDTAYFRPPAKSVVSGFFGWIYHSTLFELWAYESGNP